MTTLIVGIVCAMLGFGCGFIACAVLTVGRVTDV